MQFLLFAKIVVHKNNNHLKKNQQNPVATTHKNNANGQKIREYHT